jgi:pectate lyase
MRIPLALIGIGCSIASLSYAQTTQPALPAFPGAEGFGALATGGRGGTVYRVTNLDDSGPGSLRDAVSEPNRVIIFDVAGVIRTKSQIAGKSNLTIAGQTAPPPGITVYGPGMSFSGQTNVIARHLRLRGAITNSRGSKQLNVADSGSNMIFDHLSISWGRWDNVGFTDKSSRITLQDSIVTEAIDPQRFGAIIDSADGITVARTLWANNQNRNPKGKAQLQYINNVVYNWGSGGYGGGHSAAVWKQDLINNLFIAGPSSSGAALGGFATTDHVHASGNLVDLDKDGTLNGTEPTREAFRSMKDDSGQPTFFESSLNTSPVPVHVMPAREAFDHVMTHAGAMPQHRDVTDRRVIAHLQSLGLEGKIIRSEVEVNGIGADESAAKDATPVASTDLDADGMPDAWEREHQLDPANPADAWRVDPASGYPWLEVWLNEIAR